MQWARIVSWAALCLTAATAAGQVVPTQTGRILDSNYLIGSRGRNSIRRVDRFVDGNLYITGQVTGGREFHGEAPYAGANQLRLDLPSAGLDAFIRGSAGLDQIASGMSYGVGAYYSPERTVLGPAEIAGGLTRPGTSVPRLVYVPPQQTQRLIDAAIQPYAAILAEVGEQQRVNALVQPLAVGPAGAAGLALSVTAEAGAIRPAASTLFGIMREKDQQRLAKELTEADRRARPAQVGEPAEARLEGRAPGSERVTGQAPPPEAPAEKPGEPGALRAPVQGEDVFLDMLLTMKRMREEAEQPAPQPDAPKPATGTERRPDAGETPEEARDRLNLKQAREAVQRSRGRLLLNRLAGSSGDLFNFYMAKAEKLLAEGKYYDAAGRYEVAGILNRSNPLAPLGGALALFAANEPLSAGFHLRQGMKRFPPLMEVRPNVKRILGTKVVDLRIGQIERRIAEVDAQPDPSLVFLAAFVRSAMGERDKAVAHARRLKALAGGDKLYGAYADYLISGQAPRAAAPTTAPAP